MSENFSDEEIKKFLEKVTANKNCLYIFQPFGLIDILCSGGLAYAAQAKKNKSSTVLILAESKRHLGVAYEHIANVFYMHPQLMQPIKKYLKENDIHERDNFIYGYLNPAKPENFTVAKGLNFIDYYRKKVFDIPMDTPCLPPIITPLSEESVENWNTRYTLDKERTIIISAYINYKDDDNFNFWENLVNRLNEKNYIVYNYIENFSDLTIPNTRPIFANISELSYIANNVKCFVGTNAGLMTLIAMTTDASIFFINNFPAWIWDVNKVFPNSNKRTFYVIQNFIGGNLKSDSISIQIELSHPKINQDDIFNSYSDILEELLNSIEKI